MDIQNKKLWGYRECRNTAKFYSGLLKKPIWSKWKFYYFPESELPIIEPSDEAVQYSTWMREYLEKNW